MSEAKVGAGDVEIRLNGETYRLVPSVGAIKSISRASGGIRGATEAVLRMDIDRIVSVVDAGLGQRVVKELCGNGQDKTDKLTQLVYESGLTDNSGAIVAKCVTYLTNLVNGGRPLDDQPLDDQLLEVLEGKE